MSNCLKCGDAFPKSLVIDGKRRNLHNRTLCLQCSPFGSSLKGRIRALIKCGCGETDPKKMMNKGGGRACSSICKECHNSKTVARGRANKEAYIAYKGGKCQRCGYSRCVAALELHHPDSTQKDVSFKTIRYWGAGEGEGRIGQV